MTNSAFLIPLLPEPKESCLGYFDRLAKVHGYGSGQELLNAMRTDVGYTSLFRKEKQQKALLSLKHYFKPNLAAALERVTFHSQADERLRVKGVRVCSICIREDETHNGDFLSLYNTVCPKHGCLLIDVCSQCGHRSTHTLSAICGQCYSPMTSMDYQYSPSHKQLISDLSAKDKSFVGLIFDTIKFLARPFDLLETCLAVRDMSALQHHRLFAAVAQFIYCKNVRGSFAQTYQCWALSHHQLGAGEVEERLNKLNVILNDIEKMELVNLWSEAKVDIAEIIKDLSPAVNTCYYNKRLPESRKHEICWKDLVTEKTLKKILHVETATLRYIEGAGIIHGLHASLKTHKAYHLGDVANSLLAGIPLYNGYVVDEIRFSDVNLHTLGRFHVSRQQLLRWVVKGVVKTRRKTLDIETAVLDSLLINIASLSEKVESHFQEFDEIVSVETLAYMLCVKPEKLIEAHRQKPFRDLVIDGNNQISSDSRRKFTKNYVSLSRLTYLSRHSVSEIRDYIGSVTTESRTLESKLTKNTLYTNTPELTSLLNQLTRRGKLTVRFSL